jgi:hypothetical protein
MPPPWKLTFATSSRPMKPPNGHPPGSRFTTGILPTALLVKRSFTIGQPMLPLGNCCPNETTPTEAIVGLWSRQPDCTDWLVFKPNRAMNPTKTRSPHSRHWDRSSLFCGPQYSQPNRWHREQCPRSGQSPRCRARASPRSRARGQE